MRRLHEHLLDVLSVAEYGLTITHLVRLTKGRRIDGSRPNSTTIGAAVEALGAEGVEHSGRVELAPKQRYARMRALWRANRLDEVLNMVAGVEPFEPPTGRWSSTKPGPHIRTILQGLQGRDDGLLELGLRYFDGLRCPVESWFLFPIDEDLLLSLTPKGLGWVLHSLLIRSVERGFSIEDLHGCGELLEARQKPLQPALATLAWLRGDLPAMQEHLKGVPKDQAHYQRGALALFQGKAREASKYYAAGLAADRKRYGKEVVPKGPEAVFLVPAYLLSTLTGRMTQAIKLVSLANERDPENPRSGWGHWRTLVEPNLRGGSTTHPFAVLLEALILGWEDKPIPAARITVASAKARALGWRVVAGELEAGQAGVIAGLRTIRAPWKDHLEELFEVLSGSPVPVVGTTERRLAWTLYVASGEPYLEAKVQVRKKKGWSKGKHLAMDRLHGRGDPSLPWTDADRKLARALRRRVTRNRRGYEEVQFSWDARQCWPVLVGMGALFDRHGDPVTVVRRSASLRFEEVDGELLLSLEPGYHPGAHAVERVGTGYEVTLYRSEQLPIARKIQAGLRFPLAARAELERLVAQITPLFPPQNRGQAQPGCAEVAVWMAPKGTSITVELGVLPAGPEGPRLRAGEGPEWVLHAIEGVGQRWRRDLLLERFNADRLQEQLGLSDAAGVLDVQGALAFLAEAQVRGVAVYWPEGGRLKLRRAAGGLRLSLRAVRSWFEASGSLVLDGLELPLEVLLELLRKPPERFVRLDDGSYLELERDLDRSLRTLARVSEGSRLHPLATSAFTELLADARCSNEVRRQLEQMEQPANLQVPSVLRAELRPYQETAYLWASRLGALGAGGVLADDMGLGKTVVALAVLLSRRSQGPALVVAPTSVVGNWFREALRFAPGLCVRRLRDVDPAAVATLAPCDLLLCSYGLLTRRVETLEAMQWATVVFDESQALKNPATQRHQAARRLPAGLRLALTGTPVENHLGELHAQFEVVLPGLLGGRRRFQQRFSAPIEDGDQEVRSTLKRLVGPFLLRRTKEAVLDELPPRTDKELRIELSREEAVLYEAEREAALRALDETRSAISVLSRLTRLRLMACSPRLVLPDHRRESAKTRAFKHLAATLVASGHRALVFSQFVGHLSLLREALDDCGFAYQYLDGSTPSSARDAEVAAFQQGQAPFFLISLRAGGTGLNLTAADYVIHMDPWWNPAVEDQASDRAHRMGQQRPVTVYRLIAQGTVEEKILRLHHQKRELAAQVLEGSEAPGRISVDALRSLLDED